jgi:hypothetical protein
VAGCRSNQHAQRGVALVVTLILLSVITFMAVAFLVMSRSEKGSVTTTTDLTTARLAADSARERAVAETLAFIQAWTNEQNFGLLVSTNYISAVGFLPNNYSFTNVAYNYGNGTALNANDALRNLTNLFYSPRAPVWITNRVFRSNEFAFYLDVNRNNRYDTNGLVPVMNPTNGFYNLNGGWISSIVPGNTLSNFMVGDPEWVGGLEKPDFPHSPTNRFLYRFAYMVVPAGKALDLNYIHNYAKQMRVGMGAGSDSFLRDQGVGSWEINLASFLVDLNTNFWPYRQISPLGYSPYVYSQVFSVPNSGSAFDDAVSLLRYRYANNYRNLLSVSQLFGPNGARAFDSDNVDGCLSGGLMTGTHWPPLGGADLDAPRVAQSWWGAPNPVHYFTTGDLFDTNKTASAISAPTPTFSDRLAQAGTYNDSYNRYTYFRMLSQLGTDSAPDANKINLNYVNVDDYGNVVPDMATNFIPWTNGVQFFTNVAIRLLANAGYEINPDTVRPGPTNILVRNNNGGINLHIQVYPTNFYTASVHRLLQLAANIYDASGARTNAPSGYTNTFPSIFRPVFGTDGNNVSNVFITGYTDVNDTRTTRLLLGAIANPVDVTDINSRGLLNSGRSMLSGIPVIVGAKKGFPNFNQFTMQTLVQVTRKLEFTRSQNMSQGPDQTNQMFVVGISNVLGAEAWNSYTNAYGHRLQVVIGADVAAYITNEFGKPVLLNGNTNPFHMALQTLPVIPPNTWLGFGAPNDNPGKIKLSFQIPLFTNWVHMTNATYSQASGQFLPLNGVFELHPEARFRVPHWWFNLRTRLQFILMDTDANRIVDFVNLDAREIPVDLTTALTDGGTCGGPNDTYQPNYAQDGSFWCTNRGPGVTSENVPTFGIQNQIGIGLAIPPDPRIPLKAAAFFRFNMHTNFGNSGFPDLTITNRFYDPFEPTRIASFVTSWQANDPLVHYTVDDLKVFKTNLYEFVIAGTVPQTFANFGKQVNDRYEPWTNNLPTHSSSRTLYDLTLKDPLVGRSDDWDFPTNKYPNIGWLGRVHRGSPWQTVYLKAAGLDLGQWMKWSGNAGVVANFGQLSTNILPIYTAFGRFTTNDATFSQPIRDHDIFDVFTTAFNDDATRGQLSINNTNLAAWSAVLGGVIALTNTVSESDLNNFVSGARFAPWVIEPAGVYDLNDGRSLPGIVRIVQGINRTRTLTTLFTNFATVPATLWTNQPVFPNQTFHRLGDILSVPELTVGPLAGQSLRTNLTHYEGVYPNGYWVGANPFLNLGNTNSVTYRSPQTSLTAEQRLALNDQAYERIPQQILGLLRVDTVPRFVIYAYGQALKPAEHSLVNSGGLFGLVTNYQVTAEVATRSVVRIEGVQSTGNYRSMTNLHPVIESFNILPPD